MTALRMQLQIAWLNLVQHRRRTLLLGAAIATVTGVFLLLTGVAVGIQRTLSETAVTLTTGHLNVNGVFKISEGQAVPMLTAYEKVARVVERSVPEAAFVVHRGRGGGKIIAEGVSLGALLNGVEIAREPGLRRVLRITSGKLDDLAQPNTILLFEQQAKTLDVSVGDAVTLSSQSIRGVANTVDCRVVAVARDVGLLSSFSVFASVETLRALYQARGDVTGVLQVHLRPQAVDAAPLIAARLREDLAKAGYGVMKADARG